MDKTNQALISEGFAIIPSMLSVNTCTELKNCIKQRLKELIVIHDCSEQVYFSAVNRWPLQALLDVDWQQQLIQLLSKQVTEITGVEFEPFEIDVLYKSPYANLPTPCHQDISYVFNKPYVVSTWLALADVSITESPLQFLPGSHQNEILPAIDFWCPDFIDEVRQSISWQKQAVTVPVLTGNALIFSARIWHASLDYQSTGERFALVIRWGNSESPSIKIPSSEKSEFGMWNCGVYTQALLAKGLKRVFNIESSNYLENIKIWQRQLKNNAVPFIVETEKTYLALEKLRVLNEAYQAYSAGDGQGIVYAEVWRSLLLPLRTHIQA